MGEELMGHALREGVHMFRRLGDFFEDHPGVPAAVIGVALVFAYVISTALVDGVERASGTARDMGTPSGLATADAFPEPGETVTQSNRVRRKDGTVATRTIRAYATVRDDGTPQIIRETVRQPAPGVFVTSTQTVVAVKPGSTVTAPGSISTSVVTIPGQITTQTVESPGGIETATVAGPGETVSIPGPTTTETRTVEVPGPETTRTETVEVTVPGPEVTVTVTVPQEVVP